MDTSEKNIKYPSRVASDQDDFEKDRKVNNCYPDNVLTRI